jgi:hypothetical protein
MPGRAMNFNKSTLFSVVVLSFISLNHSAALSGTASDIKKITTSAVKSQHRLPTKNCEKAIELLGECTANDLPCDENFIADYFPSASRSTYVYLSKQKGFSEKNFTQFCKQLCKTPSLEFEDDVLKMKICRN